MTASKPQSNDPSVSVVPVHPIWTHEDLYYAASITKPKTKTPIGQYMLELGLITASDLNEGLAHQRSITGRRIGWILKTLGHFDDVTLQRVVADHQGIPCVTLSQFQPNDDYRHRLPALAAREHAVAILHEDAKNAWLATPDVTDALTVRTIAKFIGKEVAAVMVPRQEILDFFHRVMLGGMAPQGLRAAA